MAAACLPRKRQLIAGSKSWDVQLSCCDAKLEYLIAGDCPLLGGEAQLS